MSTSDDYICSESLEGVEQFLGQHSNKPKGGNLCRVKERMIREHAEKGMFFEFKIGSSLWIFKRIMQSAETTKLPLLLVLMHIVRLQRAAVGLPSHADYTKLTIQQSINLHELGKQKETKLVPQEFSYENLFNDVNDVVHDQISTNQVETLRTLCKTTKCHGHSRGPIFCTKYTLKS